MGNTNAVSGADLAKARRTLSNLALDFEAQHGTDLAFRSGVTGELRQARQALARAETLLEKLHESKYYARWALVDRGAKV